MPEVSWRHSKGKRDGELERKGAGQDEEEGGAG